MDKFNVSVGSCDLLRSSHLVSEMRTELEGTETFPVLVNSSVEKFDDIDGGYVEDSGYHLVRLTNGSLSNISNFTEGDYELHLNDTIWSLNVTDACVVESDNEALVYLHVDGYDSYPYTFKDELKEDIDKRETAYSADI